MASRSSSSGSSSSEKDTLPHLSSRGGGADRAPAAAAAPAPAPDGVGSPFIGLDHPITLYEGTKLVLMLPVVLVKVGLLCLGAQPLPQLAAASCPLAAQPCQ